MREPTDYHQLVVQRYWLREGEPPLGYAIHRYILIGLGIASVLSALVIVCLIWHQQILVSLFSLLEVPICIAAVSLARRYSGLYEVDDHGRPYEFFSHQMPSSLKFSKSLSRRRFRQYIQQRQRSGGPDQSSATL
ncbi:hypothetical protein [Thermogemmatispora sp.]|uniref:hypothetical protein n=1 Tax=Thermogemmatispora sp. TaxID=1968838 RepID=UPI0035E4286C